MQVTREDVLAFRVAAQQLHRPGPHDDAAVLDLGVQDSGPDGHGWALANRGAFPQSADLVLAWTLRGAPHAYRRSEIAAVAAAVAPFSEADAAKRVFDAARPLVAAGIPVRDGLARIAAELHDIVREPTVKGEMSRQLTARLDPPYLRDCRACGTIHAYEQPFRLAALPAGLELEPGTSPPVLRRIPGWRGPAESVPEPLAPVRGVLRFLGPTSPRLVAGYLDAPVKDVTAQWPEDVVPVEVDGQRLDVLAADVDALAGALAVEEGLDGGRRPVRLLGPFDLFLQGRDRELLVPDPAARKDLWRALGRPGGLLVGHELVGSWRPRSAGRKLRLAVSTWSGHPVPAGVGEQGERLAAFRGQEFAGLVEE